MIRKHIIIGAIALAAALAAQTNQASATRVDCDQRGCREVSARHAGPAEARHRRGRHAGHRHSRSFGKTHHGRSLAHSGALDLIVVQTAAGSVRVAREFAPKIVGFLADLVAATGKVPARITCYSTARSHVSRSLHKRGRACDLDQFGWGKTRYGPAYKMAALARKHGLRDGCEFRDWGHVDDGPHLPSARTGGCKAGPFVTYAQMRAKAARP